MTPRLAIHSGLDSLDIALDRIADIVLGGIIGIATAIFVFPDRGVGSMKAHAAAALKALGDLGRLELTRQDGVDALISAVQCRPTSARCKPRAPKQLRERALRLANGPSPEPLLQSIRCLRTDVTMIRQAMAVSPEQGNLYRSMADEIVPWFSAAAQALRRGSVPNDPLPVQWADDHVPPAGIVGLVYMVLKRDLVELFKSIADGGLASIHQIPTYAGHKSN